VAWGLAGVVAVLGAFLGRRLPGPRPEPLGTVA
jgi:hypothetical protein